jgi:hypothetical protein
MIKWSHEGTTLTDIRRSTRKVYNSYKLDTKPAYDVKTLYVITITDDEIKTPLFINDRILEPRLESYFLKKVEDITREEILSLKWNLLITKGHYVKIDKNGVVTKVDSNPDKYYISYVEVAGPLGTLQYSKLANEEDDFDKL